MEEKFSGMEEKIKSTNKRIERMGKGLYSKRLWLKFFLELKNTWFLTYKQEH